MTTPAVTGEREQVVLLGPDDQPVGVADKATVHGADTPLHLAFSCYVTDGGGRVLMTRRALSKRTWPGVWTNACCGHPAPGEDPEQAVVRRLEQELGLVVTGVAALLPDFRYRAVDASGVVENEVCPVWSARVDGPTGAGGDVGLRPDPDEVAEHAWLPWESLVAAVGAVPFALSPWCVLQVRRMTERGLRPGT
ncbi:isopentenyl-diphosphate Delta-isomerase [Thalassiella azotivora]